MNTSLTICVCGAGTMGIGIAQACAQHDLDTLLYDIDLQTLRAAQGRMNSDLQQLEDKRKITPEQKAATLKRIKFISDINLCVADIIIEAVIENADIKTKLLNNIAALNHEHTVFATNTSSLSVTSIARNFKWPEQLAGMHFFNPAPIMKLVEVVKTEFTSSQTLEIILNLAAVIGKTTVVCKDAPGFIVNRVARHYYLEALHMAEKGYADLESIDMLMEASGFRMGPFRLMDLIGNDVNLSVSRIVYEAMGKPVRLQPSRLQEEVVKHGKLGRKTGKGYYEYPHK